MKKILIAFAFIFLLFTAQGAENGSAPKLSPLSYGIVMPDRKTNFKIQRYYNSSGELEWKVDLVEKHLVWFDTSRTVIYGRDIDGDGKVEAWFIRRPDGFTDLAFQEPKNSESMDALYEVVTRKLNAPERWFSNIFYSNLSHALSTSVANADATFELYLANERDLIDLEYRIDYLKSKDPSHPALDSMYETVRQGWIENNALFQSMYGSGFWINSAADLVSFFITGKFLSWIGGTVSDQVALKWVSKNVSGMGEWSTRSLDRALFRIEEKRTQANEVGHQMKRMTRTAALQVGRASVSTALRVQKTIAGFVQKAHLVDAATQSLSAITHVVQAGRKQWFYILQTQALQVVAEGAAHWREVSDSNPIILTKNVFTNKEIIQDLAYMTNETFWMAGVSSHLSSVKQRIFVCGLIGMVDSASLNVLLKGEVDPKRAALDSGWEVVVGNLQTQIDVAAIEKYSLAAQKSGNQKVRLVGYAIALVDQFAGYFAYSKATSMLSESKKEIEPSKDAQLKIIPIYAPQSP